jgi:hypothetical protein
MPNASGPIFMFCAPEIIFGGTECVGSHFHVLHARTHFPRYRGRRVPFSYFAPVTLFRPYRGLRVPFSCFALRDSFSAVPRASGYFFMFCTPGLVFRGAECIGSRFLVLCARTCFRRYRGRRVSFSCFDRPDTFSAVPKAPGPIFMYCAPGLVFCGAESVGLSFHVLRAQNHFRRYRGRRVPFSLFPRPDSFSVVPRASGLVFVFCAR